MSLPHRTRRLRPLAALLFTAAALVPALGTAPSASAAPPEIRLTLGSQTPFTIGTGKRSVLEISAVAVNLGDRPVGHLTVAFGIGPAIRSRTVYETSLVEGPGSERIVSVTHPERGKLEPGESRTFTVRVKLGDPKVAPAIATSTDSLVYPARLEVRSRGAAVAGLNTAVIHVVRNPEERRMLLNWRAELTGPVAFSPDGKLVDRSIEEAVGPGGSLASAAAALRAAAPTEERDRPGFDLVVEPSLLEQLERMTGGYERGDGSQIKTGTGPAAGAEGVLGDLRTVVTSSSGQLATLRFASPVIPSLLRSGLRREMGLQREVGRATTRRIAGSWPAAAVERPASGLLDQDAIDVLVSGGVHTVLGDADTVERPVQENGFAPPAVARLRTTGDEDLGVVLPDPSIQALLADPNMAGDPVRAAQAVLGELMAIWREQPSPAEGTVRGISLSLDAADLPPELWGPLVERLAGASWLRPVTGDRLVDGVRPAGQRAELLDPSTASFSSGYAEAIVEQRHNAVAYTSMLSGSSAASGLELQRDLLYATAGDYLDNESAGRAWYDNVSHVTNEAFTRVHPDTDQAFTLTSTSGQVPLLMGDPGPTPLTVSIQLRSSKFEFPQGDEQTVTLTHPDQVVTFDVEAKASGQQPITVLVRAPSGRVLVEETLAVRTFAANIFALLVTALAALGLVALWVRRWFRRRAS